MRKCIHLNINDLWTISMNKNDEIRIMFQLNQEPRELTKFINDLEGSFARKPKVVAVDLIGPGALLPDTALVLHEVIAARPRGTQFVTRARSGLINASILPWLLGDRREMRSTGWVYLHISKALRKKLNPTRAAEAEDPPWCDEGPFSFFLEDNHYMADWEQVLRLIEPFLPMDDIAGKRLTATDLRDLGILDGNPIDRLLETSMSGCSAALNPSLESPDDDARPRPRFRM